MSVYPAANLIKKFKGNISVLLNKSYSENEKRFRITIHQSIGRIMKDIIVPDQDSEE